MNLTPSSIRVAVVHSATDVRRQMLAFLGAHPSTPVCLAGAELFEALAPLSDCTMDVLFVEAALLCGPDIGFLRMVRERCPGCRVVLITTGEPEGTVLELLCGGARGFINPLTRPDLLVRCAHAVAGGEAWIPRRTVANLLDWIVRNSPATLAGVPVQA